MIPYFDPKASSERATLAAVYRRWGWGDRVFVCR